VRRMNATSVYESWRAASERLDKTHGGGGEFIRAPAGAKVLPGELAAAAGVCCIQRRRRRAIQVQCFMRLSGDNNRRALNEPGRDRRRRPCRDIQIRRGRAGCWNLSKCEPERRAPRSQWLSLLLLLFLSVFEAGSRAGWISAHFGPHGARRQVSQPASQSKSAASGELQPRQQRQQPLSAVAAQPLVGRAGRLAAAAAGWRRVARTRAHSTASAHR
jgi:hypothetical protein